MKNYSIIKEIYLKRLGNSETSTITDEQRRLLNEASLLEAKLIEKFYDNNEIETLLREHSNAMAAYSAECEEDAYCEGFRIGVLVGLDVAKIYENQD